MLVWVTQVCWSLTYFTEIMSYHEIHQSHQNSIPILGSLIDQTLFHLLNKQSHLAQWSRQQKLFLLSLVLLLCYFLFLFTTWLFFYLQGFLDLQKGRDPTRTIFFFVS